jgi:hypothetical protein
MRATSWAIAIAALRGRLLRRVARRSRLPAGIGAVPAELVAPGHAVQCVGNIIDANERKTGGGPGASIGSQTGANREFSVRCRRQCGEEYGHLEFILQRTQSLPQGRQRRIVAVLSKGDVEQDRLGWALGSLAGRSNQSAYPGS